ncbi:glucosamine-6-phosphate deaminase [Cyanobium sp. WAJ14-Wanaka]|uniref:glucosamine-6-phosphate deaminase n=1 Tax=Cyanobium sp. WAJ14-Wanaka TaxID=2823725 RepID=UPI0020CDD797|nr:glucosamine-6-phosphate deaminase [Cyanobium sp. WAJ14-Wanaka]MCP9775179.1 glucosamine-6-phosphate deaminase [Cyanobium sp. WAJ14-Wanaka]
MQPHELIALADGAEVARWVAARLLEASTGTLGLATGRTMEPIYAELVRLWSELDGTEQAHRRQCWRSFNLDEYVGLSELNPQSFASFMVRHLREPLGLDPRQVRLPNGGASSAGLEAQRYADELAAAGGVGLQLLGLGLNGHVGFNEPPCSRDSPCRLVELSGATRQQNAAAFGGDPRAVPPWAITLGMAEILAADQVLLVVTGAAKAGILQQLLSSAPTQLLPASWLGLHPLVTLVADQAALNTSLGCNRPPSTARAMPAKLPSAPTTTTA